MEKEERRTNLLPRRPVTNSMQEPVQPARIPNRLPEPDHLLALAAARVRRQGSVLLCAVGGEGRRGGEDEEEGEAGPRHEGEEVGVVERVDVVEGEGRGQAEVVG